LGVAERKGQERDEAREGGAGEERGRGGRGRGGRGRGGRRKARRGDAQIIFNTAMGSV